MEQNTDKSIDPVPTPFGFCLDICRLLKIITNNQTDTITRLKFQLDGGQQFLKMSVNIVSVDSESGYMPNPNSVLTNFVIAIGQAPETSNNIREMFNYPSIRALFDLGIPKQVACDFKVAALLVGIQQAQSKHLCPYCLWRKGYPCTGQPSKTRTYDGTISDLATKSNNVINYPIICWKDSPMEVLHFTSSLVLRIDYILLRDHQKQQLRNRVVNFIKRTVMHC